MILIYQNNAWTIRRLVNETANPAYYIEDCRTSASNTIIVSLAFHIYTFQSPAFFQFHKNGLVMPRILRMSDLKFCGMFPLCIFVHFCIFFDYVPDPI